MANGRSFDSYFYEKGRKGKSIISFKPQYHIRIDARRYKRTVITRQIIVIHPKTMKIEKAVKVTLKN